MVVPLGQANRGKNKVCSILGDNIYIGPGSKIIGAVKIENNVASGANSVVTKDIQDNFVVAGIPGRIISYKGSKNVNSTDYEGKINQSKSYRELENLRFPVLNYFAEIERLTIINVNIQSRYKINV